jgi:hypothetical protein
MNTLPIRWRRRVEEGTTLLARRFTATDKTRAAQINRKALCAIPHYLKVENTLPKLFF